MGWYKQQCRAYNDLPADILRCYSMPKHDYAWNTIMPQNSWYMLTLDLMSPYGVKEHDQHWFGLWLGVLNQCYIIIKWTLGSKFRWNLNQNITKCIRSVVCKTAAIFPSTNVLKRIYVYVGVYYVNPLCCVATVCHQVHCMCWGHLGHFHRAISHLKWYKMVCMRYLACISNQTKSINMLSMFLQSGVPRHFLCRFIAVWT